MVQATYEQINSTCLQILGRYNINTGLGAVLHLLYRTGLRVEEAIQLDRFTLGTSEFIVDTEKNSLPRVFELSILPNLYFNFLPVPSYPFARTKLSSYTSVVRAIKFDSDRIYYKGGKDILSNVFRYRYAYYLQQQGYTVEQIKEAFGHISLASTLSYLSPIYFV